MTLSMTLRLRIPDRIVAAKPQDIFIGAWRPRGQLRVHCEPIPPGLGATVAEGSNWFLLGGCTEYCGVSRPGVHVDESGEHAVVFRGYLLDPPIHTWSPSLDIQKTWLHETPKKPNGIFALIRILEHGRRLDIWSDVFGISPVYFRRHDDAVLFSNSALLLAMPGDEQDLQAWMSRISCSSIYGDRTLSLAVRRAPPATVLSFDANGLRESVWYDYEMLPAPVQPINEAAVSEVEEVFQQSLGRCLRLPACGRMLPLSSGHDSRRILASLLSRKADFETATVRILQKGNRDLDATFASRMSSDFGFPHKVVDVPEPLVYARQDLIRNLLTNAETPLHTWSLALRDAFSREPSLVFDGTGGDILGDGGYQLDFAASLEPGERVSASHIASLVVNDCFDGIFRAAQWPSIQDTREEVLQWLRSLPPHQLPELAFLLLRTRRTIAPWSQISGTAGGAFPAAG